MQSPSRLFKDMLLFITILSLKALNTATVLKERKHKSKLLYNRWLGKKKKRVRWVTSWGCSCRSCPWCWSDPPPWLQYAQRKQRATTHLPWWIFPSSLPSALKGPGYPLDLFGCLWTVFQRRFSLCMPASGPFQTSFLHISFSLLSRPNARESLYTLSREDSALSSKLRGKPARRLCCRL